MKTENEVKHTLTRWTIGRGGDLTLRIYRGKKVICQFGDGIDECRREHQNAEANAQFIVTACNICDLPMVELEGIAAQGGLKAVLNRLTEQSASLQASNKAMRELSERDTPEPPSQWNNSEATAWRRGYESAMAHVKIALRLAKQEGEK